MTNLSKQIFELCNIKPKWLGQRYEFDIECRTYDPADKIFDTYEEAKEYCSEEFEPRELNVDLETNANNFVKLLGIITDYMEMTIYKEDDGKINTVQESVLTACLIELLDGNKEFKQAIVQAEWEW